MLVSSRDVSDLGGALAECPACGFIPKSELSGAALRELIAMRLSRTRLWGIGLAAALVGAALVPLIATADFTEDREPVDRARRS